MVGAPGFSPVSTPLIRYWSLVSLNFNHCSHFFFYQPQKCKCNVFLVDYGKHTCDIYTFILLVFIQRGVVASAPDFERADEGSILTAGLCFKSGKSECNNSGYKLTGLTWWP